MTTLVITHPLCLNHDTGLGHPERPTGLRLPRELGWERLAVVVDAPAVRGVVLDARVVVDAPVAQREQLALDPAATSGDETAAEVVKHGRVPRRHGGCGCRCRS